MYIILTMAPKMVLILMLLPFPAELPQLLKAEAVVPPFMIYIQYSDMDEHIFFGTQIIVPQMTIKHGKIVYSQADFA